MAELKLRSKDPDSLRRIIQSALSERLQSVTAGIKRTEERIQEFETKYKLSTTRSRGDETVVSSVSATNGN